MLNCIVRTGLAAVLAAMLCATGAVAQKITIVKMTPVEELIKKLKSDDEYARDEAMYALVQTGKKAVPALMKLVNDATALQATPPPGYDFHLGKGMQGDPKWHGGGKQFYPSGLTVNRLAIRALGLIGDPAAVDVLVDQEKRARMGLRIGDRGIRVECQRAIVGILGAKSPHVGGMRPWHLGEKGTAESAKGLANAVAGSMQAHNKGNIVEAFGPYVSIKSVDDLRRIDALAVIGSKEGSAPLLRLVKEGSRNDFQWFHCGMHNSMDLWHTLGISASAGMDDHWIAVVEAERALGHMGEKAAIPLLKNRLDDKNVMIRVSAARALAQLGDAAALPALLKDARWMNRAFIKGGYEKKVKDWAEGAWLRLWPNDDQSKVPESGQTWLRDNPSYNCIVVYDGLGYVKDARAKAFLKKRANEILGLAKIDRFYQVDLLWLASSLKKHGEDALAKKALAAGMKLFDGEEAYNWKLRHFHMSALPALAKLDDKTTLPAVVRTMLHHPSTWRPGQYDVRDVAWGAYLTLKGRRDPEKPLYTSEVLWHH